MDHWAETRRRVLTGEIATGKEARQLRLETDPVAYGVTFSADGKKLASAGFGGPAPIVVQGFDAWGLETGKELPRRGRSSSSRRRAFAGRRTVAAVPQAVGDGPTAARLWHAQDLRSSRPRSPTCDQAAYSSGRVLEVRAADGTTSRPAARRVRRAAAGWRPTGWCTATPRRWSRTGCRGGRGRSTWARSG